MTSAPCHALGHWAGLRGGAALWQALQLTRQALFAAQQVQAPESLYRWQWQTGRLLKALGEMDAAIASYRQAVDTLQSFRQEMVLGSGSSRTSFRQIIGPVYFGLVDLLLQRAAALPDRAQYEPLLVEARDAVELFKAVELRDYFKDDCVDAARQREVNLEGIAQSAITIYPILLPERTELLLSLPDGLRRVTVPVTAERLTQEVRELRRMLEKVTTREHCRTPNNSTTQLIRPLEPALRRHNHRHPGVCARRTTPHDSHGRAARWPAVPHPEIRHSDDAGLKLTDPRPLPRGNTRMLALGLTEAVQGFPALPYVPQSWASAAAALQCRCCSTSVSCGPAWIKNSRSRLVSYTLRRTGSLTVMSKRPSVLTFDDN
jgi:hypothetical protein